ncbi:TIL domain-containing protein [Meloidogyne graminicola]|uniref:TIL domain-containing protein n=1 Tax=Meloidogyne graminicola TaxID=189291 RepID=A0A8S9ZM27_9BILA|nr:TIL domain-containing protein [Meloidogyne graminicola]
MYIFGENTWNKNLSSYGDESTINYLLCSPTEEFVNCTKPFCEQTCLTTFNKTKECCEECGPPGCQCKKNYVRSGKYCINRMFCPGICCSITNPKNKTCIICPTNTTICSYQHPNNITLRENYCKFIFLINKFGKVSKYFPLYNTF